MKLNIQPEYFLFKYLWIFLLFPERSLFLVAGTAILLLFRTHYKISYTKTALILSGWATVILLSILMNYGKTGETLQQVIRDTNTALMWLVAIVFYVYYMHQTLNLKKLTRYFLVSSGILIAISLLYVWNPTLPIEILGRTLAQIDYSSFSKAGLRLRGFLEYATLNATVVIVFVPLLWIIPLKPVHKLLWLALMNLPVYLSGSRVGLISMIVLNVCYVYTMLHKKYRSLVLLFGGLFGLLFVVYFNRDIQAYVFNFYFSRQLSNNARFIIYYESINLVLKQNIFFGAGTSLLSRAGNWLGTHSQYISIFYRSGVLGTMLATAGFFGVFRQLYRASTQKILVAGYILAVLIFWVFETIDPGHIYLLMWLSAIGILSNKANWQSYDQLMSEKSMKGEA